MKASKHMNSLESLRNLDCAMCNGFVRRCCLIACPLQQFVIEQRLILREQKIKSKQFHPLFATHMFEK